MAISFPVGFGRLLSSHGSCSVARCSARPVGSVVPVIETKLRDKLAAEKVVVKDAYGDGQYLSVNVVSSMFEGKPTLERQKMVYKAVWDEVKYEEHIIEQIRVETPAEATARESAKSQS